LTVQRLSQNRQFGERAEYPSRESKVTDRPGELIFSRRSAPREAAEKPPPAGRQRRSAPDLRIASLTFPEGKGKLPDSLASALFAPDRPRARAGGY